MREMKMLMEAYALRLEQKLHSGAYHKTFELVDCKTEALRDQAHRMRHKVFCKEHGYEQAGRIDPFTEVDEYDERARAFILRHKLSNEISGMLRVILADPENPMGSFPIQKYCGHRFLKQEKNALRLFEISRFCMAPRFRQRRTDGRFLSSYHHPDEAQAKPPSLGNVLFARRRISYPQAALLRGAFEAALEQGISNGVWMTEPKHLWSLHAIGFDYKSLGRIVDIHGGLQPIVFNIPHVLATMKQKSPAIWDIVSDSGRLPFKV